MHEDDLKDLIAAVRDLMRPHLERSEPLRRVVEHVGALLIEESRRAQGVPEPVELASSVGEETSEDQSEPEHASGEALPEEADRPVPEILVSADLPLKFGGASVRVPVRDTADEIARARSAAACAIASDPEEHAFDAASSESVEIDLALIKKRCLLKAASCRLFIKRRAAAGDPVLEPGLLAQMLEMIDEAKALPNCFLWAFWRNAPQPDDAALSMIAQCYDALVHGIVVVNKIDQLGERAKDDDLREVFSLCAEANSTLRVALEMTWLTSDDGDQAEFHRWIRMQTSARSVFVPRFMTLDDRADPAVVEDLVQRLGMLEERINAHSDRLKRIKEGFNKIKYHCGLLSSSVGDDDNDHHRSTIADTIDLLGDLGVRFSDLGFRLVVSKQAAVSLVSQEDSSPYVRQVLATVRDVDTDVIEAEGKGDEREGGGWSERVLEVRELLAGGGVVMIGGESRKDAVDRIEDAFSLANLEWVRLMEHGSGQAMVTPIFKEQTRLVLVIVKLTGHLFAERARKEAKEAGKPLVMLRAGYNPEQIAEAVLQQASDKLRSGAISTDA